MGAATKERPGSPVHCLCHGLTSHSLTLQGIEAADLGLEGVEAEEIINERLALFVPNQQLGD